MIAGKNFYKVVFLLLSVSFYSFRIYDGKDEINKVRDNEITGKEVYEHIKYLSSDEMEGRFPGTKGDSLTQSYIENEFRHYGVKPAGSNGYLEPFEMVTDIELKGTNVFSLIIDGNLVPYNLQTDFIPLGYSSKGIAEGDLVFLGYGITAPEQNYDDYKDENGNLIDLNGKIVVIMRYSPGQNDPHNNQFEKYEPTRYKTLNARAAGAAGIIYINGPQSGDDNLIKLRYDNVMQDAGLPVINCKREIIESVFNNRGFNLDLIQKNIDSLKKPNSFLLDNSKALFETDIEPVRVITDNVIGFIEGNDPVLKKEVIVIGAHKDHLGYGTYGSLYRGADKQIHNGADDNASGTAGVLELAQKISANKSNLKRSILFICFAAEEAGLLGSAFFTKSGLYSNYNIVSMLNMDMIGRLTDNKLIIYGTGTSPVFINLIDSVNKSFNFTITKTPDGLGPSDHSSFYVKDVPVLHFFTGTHTDYHSPSDDVEKINTEGEVKVLDMIYNITMSLDEMKTKPEFLKVASTDNEKKSMGSVKVYVGTIPDYSATVEGMKLAGVKEGSPAEKGGLMAEDIIIKFGNKDVKNIYDYMYAMGEFKPGDEANVIVLRKNQEVSLKIVLESR